MDSKLLDDAVGELELRSQAISDALRCGDAAAVLSASQSLRDIVVDASRLMREISTPEGQRASLVARLRRLAKLMVAQREGLIRRTVMVERNLEILVPAAIRTATYGSSSGPYGSIARKTGAFKVLAA